MNKVIHIGNPKGLNGELFCRITLRDDGKLSISGVEGPKHNGDCQGSCDQIIMHEWNIASYAKGWNAEKVARFREVWNAWHLNDMRAGSPAQTAFLEANPITGSDHYDQACAALEAAGLNPDPSYLHNGKPYRYGTAWLRVDVPADVIEFLESLPASEITPAWV